MPSTERRMGEQFLSGGRQLRMRPSVEPSYLEEALAAMPTVKHSRDLD